jgi:hypothetical protein
MIISIVTFRLAVRCSVAEIAKTFQSTEHKYKGVPGLLRKNYVVSEDCMRVGGVYVWQSREFADRVFDGAWHRMVREKYGCEPNIEFLHVRPHFLLLFPPFLALLCTLTQLVQSPVMVDNTSTSSISSHSPSN